MSFPEIFYPKNFFFFLLVIFVNSALAAADSTVHEIFDSNVTDPVEVDHDRNQHRWMNPKNYMNENILEISNLETVCNYMNSTMVNKPIDGVVT